MMKVAIVALIFICAACINARAQSVMCCSSSSINAGSLDTLTGLGSATIPQFLYRATGSVYGGSFLGTSQDQYNNYAGQWEISKGTAGALDTTVGPMVKLSRTGSPPSVSCAGSADSECDAALAVYAVGTSTATDQTTAGYFASQSASVATGSTDGDSVGIIGSGRVTGSGVGLGTGGYLEGRRDTTTGSSIGAEIRNENITASNCSYNTTGIGGCDGLWITTSGDGVHTTVFSS